MWEEKTKENRYLRSEDLREITLESSEIVRNSGRSLERHMKFLRLNMSI